VTTDKIVMRKNGYNMNKDNGKRTAASRKGGNSLGIGIVAGIVIGIGLAVAIVWYLKKSPSPFVNREQPALMKPQPDSKMSAAPAEQPAVKGDGKQRFQFYTILTDKQKTAVEPAARHQPAKTQSASSKPAAVFEPQILQLISFSNADDADKYKAKLALLGVEANIQKATIPEKGVVYRVRTGPYKSADEMDHTRAFLKQNGVDSTPMRAQ
jgi:cell division protein FtsN